MQKDLKIITKGANIGFLIMMISIIIRAMFFNDGSILLNFNNYNEGYFELLLLILLLILNIKRGID